MLYRQTPTCRASDARLPGITAGADSVHNIQADGQLPRRLHDITAHSSELARREETVNLRRHDSLLRLLWSTHPGSHVIRSLALHGESGEIAETLQSVGPVMFWVWAVGLENCSQNEGLVLSNLDGASLDLVGKTEPLQERLEHCIVGNLNGLF